MLYVGQWGMMPGPALRGAGSGPTGRDGQAVAQTNVDVLQCNGPYRPSPVMTMPWTCRSAASTEPRLPAELSLPSIEEAPDATSRTNTPSRVSPRLSCRMLSQRGEAHPSCSESAWSAFSFSNTPGVPQKLVDKPVQGHRAWHVFLRIHRSPPLWRVLLGMYPFGLILTPRRGPFPISRRLNRVDVAGPGEFAAPAHILQHTRGYDPLSMDMH